MSMKIKLARKYVNYRERKADECVRERERRRRYSLLQPSVKCRGTMKIFEVLSQDNVCSIQNQLNGLNVTNTLLNIRIMSQREENNEQKKREFIAVVSITNSTGSCYICRDSRDTCSFMDLVQNNDITTLSS